MINTVEANPLPRRIWERHAETSQIMREIRYYSLCKNIFIWQHNTAFGLYVQFFFCCFNLNFSEAIFMLKLRWMHIIEKLIIRYWGYSRRKIKNIEKCQNVMIWQLISFHLVYYIQLKFIIHVFVITFPICKRDREECPLRLFA